MADGKGLRSPKVASGGGQQGHGDVGADLFHGYQADAGVLPRFSGHLVRLVSDGRRTGQAQVVSDEDGGMDFVFRHNGADSLGVGARAVHPEPAGKGELDTGDVGDGDFVDACREGKAIGESFVLVLSIADVRGGPVLFRAGGEVDFLVFDGGAFHVSPRGGGGGGFLVRLAVEQGISAQELGSLMDVGNVRGNPSGIYQVD